MVSCWYYCHCADSNTDSHLLILLITGGMQPAAFFVLMRWHCFFDAALVFVAMALACFFACRDIVFCLLRFCVLLTQLCVLLPWLWRGCFCCRGFGMVVFHLPQYFLLAVELFLGFLLPRLWRDCFSPTTVLFWWPRSCFWGCCCRGLGIVVSGVFAAASLAWLFLPQLRRVFFSHRCFGGHGVVFGVFIAVA